MKWDRAMPHVRLIRPMPQIRLTRSITPSAEDAIKSMYFWRDFAIQFFLFLLKTNEKEWIKWNKEGIRPPSVLRKHGKLKKECDVVYI